MKSLVLALVAAFGLSLGAAQAAQLQHTDTATTGSVFQYNAPGGNG